MKHATITAAIWICIAFGCHTVYGQDGLNHLNNQMQTQDFTYNVQPTDSVEIFWLYNDTIVPSVDPPTVNQIEDLVEIAVDTWNQATNLDRIKFGIETPFTTGFSECDVAGNKQNVIVWGSPENGNAEVTHCPNQDNGGGYQSANNAYITLDINEPFSYSTSPPSDHSGPVDLAETLIHEFGHVFGLRHPTSASHKNMMMWASYSERTHTPRLLHESDRAGIIYQHPARFISGDLPIDPLVLSASHDTIFFNGDVTIRDDFHHESGVIHATDGAHTMTINSGTTYTLEEPSDGNDFPYLVGGKINVFGELVVTDGQIGLGGRITVKSGGLLTIGAADIVQGRIGKIVDRPIVVDDGGSMEVEAGAELSFKKCDYCPDIEVKGDLTVSGGTFKASSAGSGTLWKGIHVSHAKSSNSDPPIIQNAVIEDAATGIMINRTGTSPAPNGGTISNNTIDGSEIGILSYIALNVEVEDNQVSNSDVGFELYKATSDFARNSAANNSEYGLNVVDNSTAFFINTLSDYPYTTNSDHGINVDGASVAGYRVADGSFLDGACSSIVTSGDEVYADNADAVVAYNWWDDDNENNLDFVEIGDANIVYDPILASGGSGSCSTASLAAKSDFAPDDNISSNEQAVSRESFVASFFELLRLVKENPDAGWASARAMLISADELGPDSIGVNAAALLFIFFDRDESVANLDLNAAELLASNEDVLPWLSEAMSFRLVNEHIVRGDSESAARVFQTLVLTDHEIELVENVEGWDTHSLALSTADQSETPGLNSTTFPNPFNPTTTIQFAVRDSGPVNIRVFNSLGQVVRTYALEAKANETYNQVFNATTLPSGLYLYKINQNGAEISTGSMMLLK